METTLRLGPTETVTVRSHDPDALEVEGQWGESGRQPPKHFHPAQDERFEVLAGRLEVELGEERVSLAPGDTLEVPRGTDHRMWNPGPDPARALWRTAPAGRTLDFFSAIDALIRDAEGPLGKVAFAPVLSEFGDVFRLAGPQPVVRPAVKVLGALSTLRRRA